MGKAEREELSKRMMTYEEILKLKPPTFLTYLEQDRVEVHCAPDNAEEVVRAGQMLGELANRFSYLSSLHSCAAAMKRKLAREGSVDSYQDMIDKQAAIRNAMDALDMQYRALSKAISIHMDNNRELYYTDGVRPRK